jgi:M6 family metalloprotease-like protein
VRLPKPSSQYSIERSVNLRDAPNGEKLWTDAIQASDPVFNFSNIQTVNFLLPKGQTFITETSQGFPWDEAVAKLNTDEGRIDSFAIPGVFMDHPLAEYWSYWAHEFGHAIGLPHVGASRGELPPFNPFDLMGGQDGPSRDLSGWLRFIAQWLPDENVYCLPAADINTLELTLVPLIERRPGVRLVIIPTSATKAIMIESRRSTKFSCGPKDKDGVLVYEYDAKLGHGENFLIPIMPSGRTKQPVPGCRVEPFIDPLLYQGNKLTIDGLQIEVIKVTNFDQVKITRVN